MHLFIYLITFHTHKYICLDHICDRDTNTTDDTTEMTTQSRTEPMILNKNMLSN